MTSSSSLHPFSPSSLRLVVVTDSALQPMPRVLHGVLHVGPGGAGLAARGVPLLHEMRLDVAPLLAGVALARVVAEAVRGLVVLVAAVGAGVRARRVVL